MVKATPSKAPCDGRAPRGPAAPPAAVSAGPRLALAGRGHAGDAQRAAELPGRAEPGEANADGLPLRGWGCWWCWFSMPVEFWTAKIWFWGWHPFLGFLWQDFQGRPYQSHPINMIKNTPSSLVPTRKFSAKPWFWGVLSMNGPSGILFWPSSCWLVSNELVGKSFYIHLHSTFCTLVHLNRKVVYIHILIIYIYIHTQTPTHTHTLSLSLWGTLYILWCKHILKDSMAAVDCWSKLQMLLTLLAVLQTPFLYCWLL